jgi:hypothetical protein
MNIVSFISTNGSDMAIGITVLFALLYFIFIIKNHKAVLCKVALALVAQAEKEYGGGTGAIKYAVVVAQLYKCVPLIVRPFVSEAMLGEIVDEAVKTLQKVLQGSVETIPVETAPVEVEATPVVVETIPIETAPVKVETAPVTPVVADTITTDTIVKVLSQIISDSLATK